MKHEVPIHFLTGGGEIGTLVRAYDWSKSPLGPPDSWPQSLRVTVRLVLNTRHPMFIWWGPELIQFYNDAYRETMGPERHPSGLGGRGRECWDEIWDIIGPQIDFVMAGKGSTWDVERLVPVTRHGRREDVWWTYSYSPIDLEGRVGGVLVVCNDVTAQHLAKVALENQAQQLEQGGQRLNLINAELKHRVKNTLTVVSAISSQTFRNLDDTAPLRAFQERLAALGRAHDLFIEANWEESSLHDVVETALAPYRTGESRLVASGTRASIGSKQALSLALGLHELATNATKYGSLSQPGGQVDISWSIENNGVTSRFTFIWRETGGPPVSPPNKKGFGSVLIARVLKEDFAGTVDLIYESTGLMCRLTTDLENLTPGPKHRAG